MTTTSREKKRKVKQRQDNKCQLISEPHLLRSNFRAAPFKFKINHLLSTVCV